MKIVLQYNKTSKALQNEQNTIDKVISAALHRDLTTLNHSKEVE